MKMQVLCTMCIKNNKLFEKIILFLLIVFSVNGCKQQNNSLYQLSNQSYSQMMSYILHYDDKTIVVDGGTNDDEEYLINQIEKISGNNTVDAWFITHYHKDHTGALTQYLSNNDKKIQIKKVYYNFPNEKWVEENESNRLNDIKMINNQIDKVSSQIIKTGDRIKIGNIVIDVLRVFNPLITNNAGNNSSSVFKFSINDINILFLGDLGVEGGEGLLKNNKDAIANMTYVQMAHHGQAGVNEDVYQVINPKYCLWPTTDWLWENKDGAYKTDETKEWIGKLNVKKNYIAKDGTISISLDQ